MRFIRFVYSMFVNTCTCSNSNHRTNVWTWKFSGCINVHPKCSRKRLFMISGSKKEFYNIVILYIIRKFGILLLYIYEGNCVSKMFVYSNLLPKT